MMRNDWIEVELGEVCDGVMGQSPPSSTYNIEGRGLPFFQGKAEFTDLHPVVQRWCDTPKRTAQPFDILLSVRAPVGSTNIANTKCAIGRGLAAITYRPEHKYVWYYLRLIEKKLDEQGTGTTFKAISGGILKSQRVSLAPLPEQRAIVSKIEQLFSELDNGIDNLKAAKKKLGTYRQAVLKKAFDGGFTKRTIKWENNTLRDILRISSGVGLAKANRNDNGNYLVYGGNGVTGRHSEYMFEDRQLIIGRVGVHCGNVHITKPKSWVTDNAFVVSFDEAKIRFDCLYYLILSLRLNQYASSTAQPVISGGRVYPVEFLLPPKEIQESLVQEIETRLSVYDNVLTNIERGLEKAESLRQSILKNAFEGKLLSEEELAACRLEPDWEPADKLLERIKKQRNE